MGSVSSAVVALAFIAQVSGMGEAFFLFGLVLFPSLFFLGTVTFDRVLQIALEDWIYACEINRIRHYYVELAPTSNATSSSQFTMTGPERCRVSASFPRNGSSS